MSLNTSSGAYEQLYDPSAPENEDKYYEGYVEMKGKFNKWTRHWCVLKKKNLHFFKDVNTQIRDNYVGYFPLEVPTVIEKKGAQEWSMKTSSRKITLRTQVENLRDGWIKGFEQSMKGEKPVSQKYILDGSGPASPPGSPLRHMSFQPSSPGPLPTSSPGPSPSRKVSSGSIGYAMTEDQIKRLTEHAQSIAENVEVSTAEIKIQEELLKDGNWYQASFRREDVEKVLQREKNGVFIVRDFIDNTTNRNMGYVVSLKDQIGLIRHHKIQRTPDGLQIKGYEGKAFDTLPNLLCFFIPSQRKKVNLVPYNPSASQAASQDEFYLEMSHPTFNGTSAAPTCAVTVNHESVSPSLSPTKPRSKSFNDRTLPPVPPAPTPGMARAEPAHHRPLPTRLSGNSPSIPESYVEIQSRVEPSQKRPLPRPPITEDDSIPSSGGYVIMTSPTLSTAGTPMSPPLSPNAQSGYVNMPPATSMQASYENIVQNRFEERAPALPPKRRSASVDIPDHAYVNLHQGREERPPRPPLRKAYTLGR